MKLKLNLILLVTLITIGLINAQQNPQQKLDSLDKRLNSIEKLLNTKSENETEKKIEWGGRIHFQNEWENGPFGVTKSQTATQGTEFRRARFFSQGNVTKNIKFALAIDFNTPSQAEFKDAYIEYGLIPKIGNIRIGQYFEPFGLEENSSSNDNPTIERSVANTVFAPSRRMGLMTHNRTKDEKIYWALGVFSDVGFKARGDYDLAHADNSENTYNITGRVVYLPIQEESRFLHIGLAASFRNPNDNLTAYPYKRDSHLGNHMSDTKIVDGLYASLDKANIKNIVLLGSELVYDQGAFSFQGEFNLANSLMNDSAIEKNYLQWGSYGQVTYTLTGESRKHKHAIMGGLTPKKNFNLSGDNKGWGALQLVARYSYADLEVKTNNIANGSIGDESLVGLNWVLNKNARIMLNYVYSDIKGDNLNGANSILTRFQVTF